MPHFINCVSQPDCQQPKTRCFQWVTDLEIVQARVATEYPVYQGRPKHNVQHVLVGREHLVGPHDRAQPLDVRCQKWTDLLSNYC
ncbi:hypothetical protein TNCV_1699071 [Trichonephila clavipes]|nr:hypothetical protein TNCV_1699071 [Trichonephila clavipes]